MGTLRLRRFADPGTLKSIRPEYLQEFLGRWAIYFARRDVTVSGGPLDYETLACTLVSPDDDTPPALLQALHLVHEMADGDRMQVLLDANEALPQERRVDLCGGDDLTPADVAMRFWLRAPDLLEEKHACLSLAAKRSFEYFASRDLPRGELSLPSPARLDALERELGEWFTSKRMGKREEKPRVFALPRPDGVWFLVRHGGVYRREGALRAGRPEAVFFRPEVHDVLVYDTFLGELRMNAARGDREFYRRKIGHLLFEDEDHFPGSAMKYSLEPLRRGPSSIVASDVEGIDWVRLVAVTYLEGGEVILRKARADDLFPALEGQPIPIEARLLGARFQVKFTDCRAPRSVALRVPNVAVFARDDDGALVEVWLQKREMARALVEAGFGREDRREEHTGPLAVA